MKERKFSKRFVLNKETVVNLTGDEQKRVLAGGVDHCAVECKSTSAFAHSSTVYVLGTVVVPETQVDPRDLPCYVQVTTNQDR